MTNAERDAIREYIVRKIDGATAKLHAEVETLRAELADVRKSAMRYRGTWQAADQYTRGDLATRDGAAWHCNSIEPTTEAPGHGVSWTLLHKTNGR